MKRKSSVLYSTFITSKTITIMVAFLLLLSISIPTPAHAQDLNPGPPTEPVRLVFIHHSTGENWLMDGYGDLGGTLGSSNYFVSDTNYGWGPGSIGDATDIVNWPQWFGPERDEAILQALYNETAQNSSYTRTLSNPGGENEVIMFKSCFPNSDLYGSPGDQPTPGDYDYSVGSSKYIYNLILDYFRTRPDKLFIAITAPPLSDSSNAANARAFNDWLVNDWLANYEGNNVAVFDFYNVLTGPENHHRYNNGQIEHVYQQGMNTNYYASSPGDDHPSQAGSRKATDEFIPLLNIYYNRWKAGAPAAPPPATDAEPPPADDGGSAEQPEGQPQEEPAQPASSAPAAGVIDDFEATAGFWHPASEDSVGSTVECVADNGTVHGGSTSLRMDYKINEGGWVDCGMSYETPQNWSGGEGIAIWLHATETNQPFNVTIISGESFTPFEVFLSTTPESAADWVLYNIPFSDFEKAQWADEGGLSVIDPSHVVGFDFTVEPGEGGSQGSLWFDDISLSGAPQGEQSQPAGEQPQPAPEGEQDQPPPDQDQPAGSPSEPESGGGISGMCPFSTIALPLGAVITSLFLRRRRRFF